MRCRPVCRPDQMMGIRLRVTWDKLAGLLLVVALHASALWGLWSHRLLPVPQEAMTLFVDFIVPPPPKAEELPVSFPPRSPGVARPQPQQLAAAPPLLPPAEYVAALSSPWPVPVIEAPPIVAPKPVGPVMADSELSASCPERTAPAYPLLSRRMGEAGIVVLRVELDEEGLVTSAHVGTGSGYARLDEAALAAVRTWRCNPAQRNGRSERTVALQSFKFILQ